MRPEQIRAVEEIFFRIRELPPEQRRAALDEMCNGDRAVRAEVESLLESSMPPAFMATPVLGAGVVTGVVGGAPDTLVGRMVGPWRIERLIGAGGMGSVYLAARADGAFEGRAAIKVVKRGMDTDDILGRFRTERRTLANLNHPNIAMLHDAGSLPDGRPYLVMEYVDGRPITQYCQENRLNTGARVRLFTAVCGAVQFAHQNLVVHRDLKPGNIFVAADGTPKLLDFGIAKVLSAGADAIAVTGVEERRLTPEYASPEQVEGRPVTTATDVYSLGVILYELLTGQQPYRFETRSTAEIQRVVGAGVVVSPSVAVTRDAPAPTRTDTPPARLERELRGDLDTIVLMAMRKEPQRRYVSAEQLAGDLDAYLRGMPVAARRDTLAYRTGKFIHRHRLAVAAAAVVAAAMGAGVATIARQSQVARNQRDQAFLARDQAEAIAKFLQDMLGAADPQMGQPGLTIREVLDRSAERIGVDLADQPLVRAAVRSAIGSAYVGLGEYDRAEAQIRAAYESRLKLLPAGHHDVAESMIDMGTVLYAKRRFAEAEEMLRGALKIFRTIRGAHNLDVGRTLNNLGAVLRSQGKLDEAADALRQAVDMRRVALGNKSLDLAESLNNYAGVLREQRRVDEARAMLGESLEIRRALLPPDHPLVAQSIANLAVMIAVQGDLDRAEPLFKEALDIETLRLGPDHPDRAHALSSLASVRRRKGDPQGAETYLREALRVRRGALAPADARLLHTWTALTETLLEQGRTDDARHAIDEAVSAAEAGPAEPAAQAQVYATAARVYEKAGQAEQAARFRERAGRH